MDEIMQDLHRTVNHKTIFKVDDFEYMKNIILEAGKIAVDFQESNLIVSRKKDSSIVTQADIEVQDFIVSSIRNRFSNINFVYEEEFDTTTAEMSEDKISVIIDPIDGTAMFSMHLPIWCISIGVFRGFEPVYGFVYSPGAKMFFCNDEKHAYLNGEIVSVDRHMKIDTETNLFYSTEVKNIKSLDFPGKVRNLGSTALHACLTVDNIRNRVIGFIGKAFLWDWAGAVPIIRKAGGDVKYMNGNDIDFRQVADNGYRFADYVLAYNCSDFSTMRNFFVMK